jgi:hypothetical protein
MAEIPIQRKSRRSAGPLILLVLIVLGAAWYFWARSVNATSTTSADSTATAPRSATPDSVRTQPDSVRSPATAAPGNTPPTTP